jgi:outer membrane lipoprotein carrier protein
LDQNEVEEGTVTLAPGGRMRWEYTRPAGKLAVADGKTSTLYLPENREAFVQPLDPGGPLLFRLLAGQVKLEEELVCEGVTAQGDRAVMDLRLIKRDAEVQRVEVTIVAATGQVVQVRYKDPLGNEVSLALSDIQRPVSAPESSFLFKVPPGTRIIRAQ